MRMHTSQVYKKQWWHIKISHSSSSSNWVTAGKDRACACTNIYLKTAFMTKHAKFYRKYRHSKFSRCSSSCCCFIIYRLVASNGSTSNIPTTALLYLLHTTYTPVVAVCVSCCYFFIYIVVWLTGIE